MKQNKNALVKFFLLVTVLLFTTVLVYANRGKPLPPLVSTEWVITNSGLQDIVLLDIRGAADYAAGHIAASINAPFEVPFSAWITMRNDLLLEVPETADLFNALGSMGITLKSRVVVITSGTADPPFPLANANRVADTLLYAGVRNVTILDGGFDKWAAEGKPVTTAVPAITPATFSGCVDTRMFVSREYVKSMITRKHKKPFVLIDTRDEAVYTGAVIEPYAAKPGHIPTAKSLPAVLLWTADGKYKPVPELAQIAAAVVGDRKGTEIVVYCGVGGYASTWWYVLTSLLGYTNVKFYDGSAQEWVLYEDMVID